MDLNEEIVQEAMKLLGAKTKREAVHRALEAIIIQKRRENLQAKLGRLDLKLTLKDLKQKRRDD